MYKIEATINDELKETTYHTKLENGLHIYICKKTGFEKKIGMFGTKYGSVTNDFIDIETKNRVQVPDGVAHFLEHKLFEKEGENALDVFSKIGVSSNAYTTFDHTVFYFETIEKFQESIKLLIHLVKEPYFTEENVEKEKGIIGQEIMMGDDDPSNKVYFNTLKALYVENNVKIDIAGTIPSISKITKEDLYTCYRTFYNLSNMFFVVVGDVEVEQTISLIDQTLRTYHNTVINHEIEVFEKEEPNTVASKEIIEKMDIYMPQICIGYKLNIQKKEEIIKNAIIADMVSDMYFSKMTHFFKEMYDKKILSEPPILSYEGVSSFSHVILGAESTKIYKLRDNLINYLDEIQEQPIDDTLFQTVKNSKIGMTMLMNDNLNSCYRRIIDSILSEVSVYTDIEVLEQITKEDIAAFLTTLNKSPKAISILDKK